MIRPNYKTIVAIVDDHDGSKYEMAITIWRVSAALLVAALALAGMIAAYVAEAVK